MEKEGSDRRSQDLAFGRGPQSRRRGHRGVGHRARMKVGRGMLKVSASGRRRRKGREGSGRRGRRGEKGAALPISWTDYTDSERRTALTNGEECERKGEHEGESER